MYLPIKIISNTEVIIFLYHFLVFSDQQDVKSQLVKQYFAVDSPPKFLKLLIRTQIKENKHTRKPKKNAIYLGRSKNIISTFWYFQNIRSQTSEVGLYNSKTFYSETEWPADIHPLVTKKSENNYREYSIKLTLLGNFELSRF